MWPAWHWEKEIGHLTIVQWCDHLDAAHDATLLATDLLLTLPRLLESARLKPGRLQTRTSLSMGTCGITTLFLWLFLHTDADPALTHYDSTKAPCLKDAIYSVARGSYR